MTSGIAKNVHTDNLKRSPLFRWFRAVLTPVPFTLDGDVTTFQVFPDYTGALLTTSGNTCDQITLYGQVAYGVISENNDVEVFGRRDRRGAVVASSVRNTATGTSVKGVRSLRPAAVRAITAAVLGSVTAGVVIFASSVTPAQLKAAAVNAFWSAAALCMLIYVVRHPLEALSLVMNFFIALFKGITSLLRKRD